MWSICRTPHDWSVWEDPWRVAPRILFVWSKWLRLIVRAWWIRVPVSFQRESSVCSARGTGGRGDVVECCSKRRGSLQILRYVGWEVVSGDVKSRQVVDGWWVAILHRCEGNIGVVIRVLCVLRRKLSFLCGRRFDDELPLQLWVRLEVWGWGKFREASISFVRAQTTTVGRLHAVMERVWRTETSEFSWIH